MWSLLSTSAYGHYSRLQFFVFGTRLAHSQLQLAVSTVDFGCTLGLFVTSTTLSASSRGHHSRLHLAVITFAFGYTLGVSNILDFNYTLDFG